MRKRNPEARPATSFTAHFARSRQPLRQPSVRRTRRIRNAIHARLSLLRQQNNTLPHPSGAARGSVFDCGNHSILDNNVSRIPIVRAAFGEEIL